MASQEHFRNLYAFMRSENLKYYFYLEIICYCADEDRD